HRAVFDVTPILSGDPAQKGRGSRRALGDGTGSWSDQKSIPPPPGMDGAAPCFFGTSATIASVVISRPATEAAPCSAWRTTLVGSMIPFDTRLPYSPVCASKPKA